ncbi:MAG: hypothetical protein A2885_03385 [Sphingopyxis sp. RIFCSPHIGHO2_01_FULL_65_24]|nr:MAG: hypothetical protein A2885_03385 [Sphingopyxis sp. RIFCSPHIGHO2_01_FULL_65_24]
MRFLFLLLMLALWPAGGADAQDVPPLPQTEVVILGVDHSAQLINRRQQPGAVRAFVDAIGPAAICIERAPDRFARNDHYEFTYEIQDLLVPLARERGLPLCPFDWLPSAEDSALGLGIADLEAVPLLRREAGFQGFLTFPDPRSRTHGLFFADAPEEGVRHRAFYADYPDRAARDFPRRLFLYRTFMQAQRIAAAARAYPGQRMLVVVGAMHKADIEQILAGDPAIRTVQPSAIAAEPDAAAMARFTRMVDLAAIATFNLLGTGWRDPHLDRAWMAEVVSELERRSPGAESALLAARLAEREGARPRAMLARYLVIARRADAGYFTWTGVKDRSRIDSFFDPFGNLPVADRALLEAARIHIDLGERSKAMAIRRRLAASLGSDFKRLQFDGYWARYVERAAFRPVT